MCSFITHTDADGIISALLFKEYNTFIPFKGFYNLKSFYLTSPLKDDDIGVDLDLNNIKTIGHHINPFHNENAENPNNEYLEDFYKQFYSKCPLNTVMILLNKYNIKITTLRQLALVMFSDGFFTYYNKYTQNCDNWLKKYGLEYLITMYKEDLEKVQRIIDEEIVPIFSPEGKYNSLKVVIKDGELQNKEIIREFSQYVIDAFGLYVVPTLFEKDYKVQEDYIVKEIPIHNQEEYNKVVERIKELQKDKTIVSSAMTFKDLIKVTMTKNEYIY